MAECRKIAALRADGARPVHQRGRYQFAGGGQGGQENFMGVHRN